MPNRDTKNVGVHHVYQNLAEFNRNTHDYGTIAIFRPDDPGQNGMIAVHDDITPGGSHRAYLIPAGLPLPPVIPPVPVPVVGVVSHQVCHNLGFYPVVQVIDGTGDVIDVDITHDDMNCFTISAATPVTGNIIFR